MQMNELTPVDMASKAPSAEDVANASPEVFQQLGTITRQLHDTLTQLGVLPSLSQAAGSLPDARSRLNYIAEKTAAAADKVLNSVDAAKADHAQIAEQTRRIAAALVANPVKAVASGAVLNFVSDVEAATARIDAHLTDIMMAQDFHDLTGQEDQSGRGRRPAGEPGVLSRSVAAPSRRRPQPVSPPTNPLRMAYTVISELFESASFSSTRAR
jgi:hypothetical protein